MFCTRTKECISQIFVSLVRLIPALQTLWGQGDYKAEMEEMLAEQAAFEAAPRTGLLQLLRDKTIRWQLLTMCIIYSTNQLSGTTAVRMKTPYFLLVLASKQWRLYPVRVKPMLLSFPDQYLHVWHLPGGRYTGRQDPLCHSWSWGNWNPHLHHLCE